MAATSLPSAVDLSGQLPPIGDQGQQGSCVAWATGYYYHSWLQKREHTGWNLQSSWYQFSPAFIYNQINGGTDYGSTFPDAFDLLMNSGCTDLAQMPYNQYDYTTQPNSLQRNAARQYRINSYSNMWRLSQIPSPTPAPIENAKAWLASGNILVMGIPIFRDFPGWGGPNTYYYDYNEWSGLVGHHAVTICGYNDNANPGGHDADHRGGFKMANSWGSSWNNGGYIYLSYDFVKRYVPEAWTMQDRTPDTPSISSLSAYCGRPGSSVTIYGTNFGALRRNAWVSFNGISASVSSWTNESITVTVPSNFGGGPLRVYDWEGNPSNPVNFTVGNPSLSSISPTSGPSGTQVTLSGSNFGASRGSSYVNFGSTQAATYDSWSDTRIVCRVPDISTGTVQVKVTTGVGTTVGLDFTVTPSPPSLSSISPTSGTAGTQVTLSGSNFGASRGSSYVLFGSTQAATYDSWSDTRIVCRVPDISTGTVQVKVTTGVGTSNGLDFRVYKPSPFLSSVSPSSAPPYAEVTLTGYHFGDTRDSSYVLFGEETAYSYKSWSDTRIVCRVPDISPGTVQVKVVVPDAGTSNGINFTVNRPAVVIESLSPTSGPVRTSVAITGYGFGSSTGSKVYFGSVEAEWNLWSNTRIDCFVPNISPGTVQVKVVNGTGTSNGADFTVTSSPPSLSSVSPSSGPAGTQVTLSGSNFGSSRGSSYVLFGSTQATTYDSWSDTRIVCRVPSLPAGTVQVKVVTAGGTSNGLDFLVSVNDTYEPNDSFEQAYGPLQAGREYSSYIMPGESKDYYCLDLPQGCRTLRVLLAGIPQGCDYDLYVYGADRGLLAFSNRGGNSDDEVVIQDPAAGRCYLEVRSWSGSSAESAYRLSFQIEQVTDTYEPNDSFEQAYGPLQAATDYLSYISRDGDEDFYRISITEECASFTVRLENIADGCDYDLAVYDSGRHSVGSSVRGGNDPEVCNVDDPSAGTFFIRVYPYHGHSESVAYRLRMEVEEEDGGAPVVESLSPPYGKRGEGFVISGRGLSPTGTAPTVTLDGVPCEVTSYDDSHVDCLVPEEIGTGRKQLQVRAGGSTSDTIAFLVCSGYVHFPYCCDGQGISSFLCLLNPAGEGVPAVLEMCSGFGDYLYWDLDLDPHSRTTLRPGDLRGGFFSGSLTLAAAGEVMAELPSYQSTSDSLGGDTVIGATRTSERWYFAEGYTGRGFRETIHVQVPGDRDAALTFRFQTEERGEVVIGGLRARCHEEATSFSVNDLLGTGYQCSLTVESDVPVVAQRDIEFTYISRSGECWQGVHRILGAVSLGRDFLFAEGTTRDGFDEWLTIQNPSAQSIEVRAEFQVGEGQGSNLTRDFRVSGWRRLTVFVPDIVGRGKDVSVRLTSSAEFLAERPMYFRYRGFGADWDGGHCAMGTPAAAEGWLFAEGCTYGGFHEWLCLQNPGDGDAQVDVYYYTQERGLLAARRVNVAARRRVTIRVNDHAGGNLQLSCRLQVVSGPAIVAERPLYFTQGNRCGGHTAVGFQQP